MLRSSIDCTASPAFDFDTIVSLMLLIGGRGRDRPKAIFLASVEAEGGRSRISVYLPTNEVNIIPDNKKLKNVHAIFLNCIKLT